MECKVCATEIDERTSYWDELGLCNECGDALEKKTTLLEAAYKVLITVQEDENEL